MLFSAVLPSTAESGRGYLSSHREAIDREIFAALSSSIKREWDYKTKNKEYAVGEGQVEQVIGHEVKAIQDKLRDLGPNSTKN